MGKLAAAVQQTTGDTVELIYADQGYTGERPAKTAHAAGIDLCVVEFDVANKAFVLTTLRRVVVRSFAWMTRYHGLVEDRDRYAQMLAGTHIVAYACTMLNRAADIMWSAQYALLNGHEKWNKSRGPVDPNS